jgi:hypothetical protein
MKYQLQQQKLKAWGKQIAAERGWIYARPTRDGQCLMFYEDMGGPIKTRIVEIDPEATELSCYRIKGIGEGVTMNMEMK